MHWESRQHHCTAVPQQHIYATQLFRYAMKFCILLYSCMYIRTIGYIIGHQAGYIDTALLNHSETVRHSCTTTTHIRYTVIQVCHEVLYSCMYIRTTGYIIGHQAGYIDTALLNHSETVRHKNCKLIIHPNSSAVRCSACSTYRSTLLTQKWKRASTSVENERINYRFVFFWPLDI